jgi:amidohydrolase
MRVLLSPAEQCQVPQPDASVATNTTPAFVLDDSVRDVVFSKIDELNPTLRKVNAELHSHPESAYQEVFAHDLISDYLESLGFAVQRHAWGIDTSFEASIGTGGHHVVFCAEYDALPEIGHACGHNLIATASVAAFLGAAEALEKMKMPGRLRLLGTPAEERYGGKIALLKKGAFDPPDDIAGAIMAHSANHGFTGEDDRFDGIAGCRTKAIQDMTVEFFGRSSHASASPWKALNALDAAVASYNNVSMLRQQIQPDERISGVFQVGGTVSNVIPEYTRMSWSVRSPTLERLEALLKRVVACFEAGAAATGCRMRYKT